MRKYAAKILVTVEWKEKSRPVPGGALRTNDVHADLVD